jgi:replicative DNA helicase
MFDNPYAENVNECEKQLLGSILMWPERWPEVAERITPDHWHREAHRKLFQLMSRRVLVPGGLGMVPLVETILEEGIEEQVGGIAYLTSLPEETVCADSIYFLMDVMERAKQRRALRDVAGIILAEPEGDPGVIRAKVESALQDVGREEQRRWMDGAALAEATIVVVREREAIVRGGGNPGWRTGLPKLDHQTGGLRPKQVFIVAGRPGMGKSVFVLETLLRLALDGHRCALFSLEMPADVVGQRLFANMASVNADALRDGRLTRDEWTRINEAAERLYDLPLYVDDRSASLSMIRARVQALAIRVGPIDVVGVDYIQIVQGEAGVRYANRNDEVGQVARGLQAFGKDLGHATLIAAQLSRAVEGRQDKHPQMSDLRESGDIEAVGDAIVGLMRPEYYDEEQRPGEIDVDVLKARHGKPGRFAAMWHGPYQRVRELSSTAMVRPDQDRGDWQ